MVESVAGVPRLVGAAGLPGDLLLLPSGLLPLVLLVAARMRGKRRPQALFGREPLSVLASEFPSLLLLVIDSRVGLSVVGRGAWIPVRLCRSHRQFARRRRRPVDPPALRLHPLDLFA